MRIKEFIYNHKNGVAIFSIVLICIILTCIYNAVINIRDINTIQPILDEYSVTEPVTEDEFSVVSPTDKETVAQTISEDKESEYEEEIKELQNRITQTSTLEDTLSKLIKNYMDCRTGIRGGDRAEGILKDIKPYVTDDCYDNYLVPYYEATIVSAVNWEASNIKFSGLDTDTPKAFMYIEKNVAKAYCELEFKKVDGKWYVDNETDYEI